MILLLVVLIISLVSGVQGTVPVRLINGDSPLEGFVQVYIGNSWGSVCNHQWSFYEARVVCRQLNYLGPDSRALYLINWQRPTGAILLDNVVCRGEESSLLDCSNDGVGIISQSCDHTNDAAVQCTDDPVYHMPLQVRLFGGAHGYEGRLEVTRNGTWGTVCGTGFSRFDGEVICRQLGFELLEEIYSSDRYGPGDDSMPVYLKDPSCLGQESSIGLCSNALWANYVADCDHEQDVGIYCFVSPECPPFNMSHGEFEFFRNSTPAITQGTVVRYTCEPGYTPNGGVHSQQCDARGQWQLETPGCLGTCSIVNTSFGYFDFQLPENESLPVVGTTLNVSCHSGYGPYLGVDFATCETSYRWEPFPPYCDVLCPNLTLSSLGLTAYNISNLPGATITFTCESNMKRHGPTFITCKNGGTWTSSPPTCRIASCTEQETLSEHLQVTREIVPGSTLLHFSCEPGWHIVGAKTISCEMSGNWSMPYPVCTEGGLCPSFNYTSHVYAYQFYNNITEELIPGTQVASICNDGYYGLKGQYLTTCTSSLHWNPVRPGCYKLCPSIVLNSPGLSANTSDSYSGTIVEFTCAKNRTLHGAALTICLDGGHWSSFPPTCLLPCPELSPLPLHLHVSSLERAVGVNVSFYCDIGWHVVGELTATCLSNESWSNALPTCAFGGVCPSFNLSHGNFIFDMNITEELIVETVVTVKCEKGYGPRHGLYNSTCDVDLHWKPIIPGCHKLCPSLPLNGTGLIASTSSLYVGTSITFSCNGNKRLEGPDNITCLEGGLWSSILPTCHTIMCETLHLTSHVLISSMETVTGSVVHFSCDEGWHVVGATFTTCTYDGSWSQQPPSCDPGGLCSSFNQSRGSFTFHDNITAELIIGTVVFIECDDGYGPRMGHHNSTCASDLEWQPCTPGCFKLCQDLNWNSSHLVANTTSVSPGTHVHFKCQDFTILQGPSTLFCMDGGHWSTSLLPTCQEVLCSEISLSAHLSASSTNNSVGSTVNFICDRGWHVVGATSTICTNNGTWTEVTPVCSLGGLCPSFNLSHGVFSYHFNITEQLTSGTLVSVKCEEGYGPVLGQANSTCGLDLLWEPVVPGCQKKCPTLMTTSNGLNANSTSIYEGSTIGFFCDKGQELHGPSSIVCISGGHWSSIVPICINIMCSSLVLPSHTSASSSLRSVGTNIHFTCESGWQLKGPENITCQANGNWNQIPPTCAEDLCSSFNMSHGIFQANHNSTGELVSGSVVSVHCEDGYGPECGYYNSTCTAKLQWEPVVPGCHELCSILPFYHDDGLLSNTSNYFIGTHVRFYCKLAKKLVGPEVVTCLHGGQWSSPLPVCQEITCPELILSDHLIASSVDASAGNSVQFSCDKGWILEGATSSACLNNGSWSLPFPICISEGNDHSTLSHQLIGMIGGLSSVVAILLIIVIAIVIIFTLYKRRKKLYIKLQHSNDRNDIDLIGIRLT